MTQTNGLTKQQFRNLIWTMRHELNSEQRGILQQRTEMTRRLNKETEEE